MDHYIAAIRAAADSARPEDLKPALDFIIDLAREDYKAGALDEIEIYDILNEYTDTLMRTNAVNYH